MKGFLSIFSKKTSSPKPAEKPAGLADLVTNEIKTQIATAVNLPNITDGACRSVIEAIHFLDSHYLREEGIYRKSGMVTEVNAMIDLFLKGETPDFTHSDPHAISGAVKGVFRVHFAPLLTYELFSDFCTAGDDIASIRRILLGLPVRNLTVLEELCHHLHNVTDNTGFNLMTANNLALTVGQHLLRPNANQDLPGFMWNERTALAKILISNSDQLFAAITDEEMSMVPATAASPTANSPLDTIPTGTNTTTDDAKNSNITATGSSDIYPASEGRMGVNREGNNNEGSAPVVREKKLMTHDVVKSMNTLFDRGSYVVTKHDKERLEEMKNESAGEGGRNSSALAGDSTGTKSEQKSNLRPLSSISKRLSAKSIPAVNSNNTEATVEAGPSVSVSSESDPKLLADLKGKLNTERELIFYQKDKGVSSDGLLPSNIPKLKSAMSANRLPLTQVDVSKVALEKSIDIGSPHSSSSSISEPLRRPTLEGGDRSKSEHIVPGNKFLQNNINRMVTLDDTLNNSAAQSVAAKVLLGQRTPSSAVKENSYAMLTENNVASGLESDLVDARTKLQNQLQKSKEILKSMGIVVQQSPTKRAEKYQTMKEAKSQSSMLYRSTDDVFSSPSKESYLATMSSARREMHRKLEESRERLNTLRSEYSELYASGSGSSKSPSRQPTLSADEHSVHSKWKLEKGAYYDTPTSPQFRKWVESVDASLSKGRGDASARLRKYSTLR